MKKHLRELVAWDAPGQALKWKTSVHEILWMYFLLKYLRRPRF